MEEQRFDISIDRVSKIPVPLLVVGLGGTGTDAVVAIKRKFAERYVLPRDEKGQEIPRPEQTAYLAIDGMSERPKELDVEEYVDISLPGLKQILDNKEKLLYPHERPWVNKELKLEAGSGTGFGTVRQAGRLGLSRNYKLVETALTRSILNVVSKAAGQVGGVTTYFEVAVVAGIGGGTGSGIFLDMAQIIRNAATRATVIPCNLTGYIVMPDVSIMNAMATPAMKPIIQHNAYAALKELDFWMRVKQHGIRYRMKYGVGDAEIEWNNPPFDHCILMSCSNVAGTPYKDGYQAVLNTIAENLLHYMAQEAVAAGQTKYSYVAYENNLAEVSAAVVKNYPVYYGYRAIGAFTKRIPKKAILYYEGSLLLSTFIPLRDSSGKLQPDRRMFTDGRGKVRAENITGKGSQLMQDFRVSICKLPDFCNIQLNDPVKVAAVQVMNPAPHNRWHKWRDDVSSPAAVTAADEYLQKAWERFEAWATGVIMDPDQGPFALQEYLEASDGLIGNMEETLTSWTAQLNKVRSIQIAHGEEMCKNSWGSFCRPPLLGKQKALEQYDQAIKSLYTYVNNCQFLEKHTVALEKLVLRVQEYLRDGLKPLCASLEFLEQEFNSQDGSDQALIQDIYNLGTVQASIDAVFKQENAGNKLSAEFLRKIAEISLRTVRDVDAKSSGVAFICRQVGLEEMCRVLQADMEAAYGDVNNQSLDDIMIANVGNNIPAQQAWIDQLANSVLSSAAPMFMQDTVHQSEDYAHYSYLSVPEDAKKHIKRIDEAFSTSNVTPKKSTLKDHLYALMAWDALPLYRYGMIEEMRQQYNADCVKTYGIHLVWNGDDAGDFQTDWRLLPSPKPQMLFPGKGYGFETARYQQIHQLVDRGIKAGMIQIEDDLQYPRGTVSVLYAPGGNAILAGNMILEQKEVIEREKNPASGAPYSETEIAQKLQDYLDSGKKTVLQNVDVKPAMIASALNLQNDPCDPWDPGIQGNSKKLKDAWDNHRKLSACMIETLIYLRPDVVHALQLQLDAYETIRKVIDDSGKKQNLWNTRIGYAEKAANIFLFLSDSIFQGGSEYKYKDKGNKYDILTPEITAGDIREMESAILRTAAFLADAPEQNAAKADLTRKLELAMRDYDDAVDNESMTREDLEELMTAAEDTSAELADDKINAERMARTNPERKDILDLQVAMISEMIRILDGWKRNFRKIMKKLD